MATYRLGIRVGALMVVGEQVVVIERRKQSGLQYSLPGGNVENEESIQQCFVREMAEEIGVTINSFRPLYYQDMIIRRDGVDGIYRKAHFIFHCILPEGEFSKINKFEKDDALPDGKIVLMDHKLINKLHLYPAVGAEIGKIEDIRWPGEFRVLEPMTNENFEWM